MQGQKRTVNFPEEPGFTPDLSSRHKHLGGMVLGTCCYAGASAPVQIGFSLASHVPGHSWQRFPHPPPWERVFQGNQVWYTTWFRLKYDDPHTLVQIRMFLVLPPGTRSWRTGDSKKVRRWPYWKHSGNFIREEHKKKLRCLLIGIGKWVGAQNGWNWAKTTSAQPRKTYEREQ